jgi:hypothetical protein
MKNPLAILQGILSSVFLACSLSTHRWERFSQIMVSLSILAFLPLQVPQIWRNFSAITSQDPTTIAHLQVIPVLGYVSGMVANLLLMCYLADRQERWGAIVQCLGIVTSGIVVTQLFSVGLVRPILFAGLILGMGLGMSFNILQLGRSQDQTPSDSPSTFDRLWGIWKNGLNIVGLTLFPWILTWQLRESLLPNLSPTLSLGFGLAGSGVLLGLSSTALLENRLPPAWSEHPLLSPLENLLQLFQRYWAVLSGWTANLLFMFGPAAQLMANVVHPDSIAALALPTQFLSAFGNLLILTRSGTLFIQGHDRVWAVGSFWEVTVRGLVFLTIAYYGFMDWGWFEGYAVGVCVYGVWIYQNARTSRTVTAEVQNILI